VNKILGWSKQDQLGFCFYLFDYNGDGFVCIEDLYNLMEELSDSDLVIREDVNKLVSILKQKGKKLKQQQHISPIIYGIYDKFESKKELDCYKQPSSTSSANLIYNDYLA
jgi:hypothetical protein